MLEYVMLVILLAIYTKKYWKKKYGEIMAHIKNNVTYTISLVLLSMGLVLMVIGVLNGENFLWIQGGTVMFSWGIAFLAFKISGDSAKILKTQSNVLFLQVINMVEDARSYYLGRTYKPDLFGWKTQSFIQMAVELLERYEKKEYIKLDFQDRLFHYFNISFEHLFKYSNWEKEKNSIDTGINNFTKAYAMLEDYYNDKRKGELEDFIKGETKIDYDEFYTKVADIKRTKNYGIL